MSDKPSILKALSLLNKDNVEASPGNNISANLPTAKSRSALDTLVNSTPRDFDNVDVRALLQNLFNWDGNNKVNKPLIKTCGELLRSTEYYPQFVEFTGYAVALAPFLEADHLNRMYGVVKETKTAFAPTLYTINFHSNIKRAFEGLSQTRVEKIALSLWHESHNGRWWNMTAGIDNIQENQREISPAKLLKNLKKYNEENNMENIIWSQNNQAKFSEYMKNRMDKDIAVLAESFRKDLMMGKAVTPDIAIYLSSINWLAPSQRPESPINSLLKTLVNIRKYDDNFIIPKKPNTIKDMFPDLSLTVDERYEYPFDINIVNGVMDKSIIAGVPSVKNFKLIGNRTQLASNARHMGNCTLTYASNMEKGTYALLHIQEESGNEYNVSLILRSGKKWGIGEINTRFNAGGVPENVRQCIKENVDKLPPVTEHYLEYIKKFDKDNNSIAYTYAI